jgi:hypothetical protein
MFISFTTVALLTPTPDLLDTLTNLGSAGFMGAMWLWERRTSRQREQQLDEAHDRICGDRVVIDELLAVVRQNAEALASLTVTQDQLLDQLKREAK